jgi:outer membrane protein assembly factor BamD
MSDEAETMRSAVGRLARRTANLGVVLGVLCGACASTPEVEEVPTAETYYNRGLESLEPKRRLLFFKTVDYPVAISNFQEVIDNYPYSEFATLAELQIADVHFDRKAYEEAASYYQDFVELHPRHEMVPYALFRNGLCSFERMGTSDRDQGATREAISHFRALLERYPASENRDEARRRLQEAEDLLAQVDIEVGKFYFDQGEYHAATERFRRALTEFPSHTGNLTTMSMLGVALLRSGNPVDGERLLSQVLASNPDRELRELIDSELYEITALPGYNAMLEQVPESGVLQERPSFTRRLLRAGTAPFRLIAKPFVLIGSGAGKAVQALFSIF